MRDGGEINNALIEWVLHNNHENKKFVVKVSRNQFIIEVQE